MTTTVNINSALKINVTPIESGASGGVLFQKSDGKLGQSSNLHWDNTNSRLSISQGTAPGARLDVRAQGTLSTDLAFRVSNGANTSNFLVVNGAGDVFNNGAGGVTSNTFYGENVGRNATGVGNTFMGTGAGQSTTTGSYNTANGVNALLSNTTGGYNTANGANALRSNTTGGGNTANGLRALQNNTTGSSNTANGVNALFRNTTGENNTANGSDSLFSNTTGSNNTANGASALQSNTTGLSNTANGVNALFNNTTGGNNTANGVNAGRFIADGVTDATVVSDSVLIGAGTRVNANNETNQIVIGNQAIGTGSNSVTLGNTSITRTNLRGQIVISGFASAPVGIEGAIYYDTVLKKHYGFNGTNWNALY